MPETIYSKAGADAATAAAIAAQGLGTAAITDATDYATAAQGSAADTAVQPTEPTFRSTTASEAATLGAEIVVSDGWTLGAGWSGTLASGFTHTVGTATLAWAPSPALTPGDPYFVEFTVASPTNSSAFAVTLGGSYPMEMYEGAAGGTWTYSRGITPLTTGPLTFTPQTAFDGRIHSVSVKPLAADATPAASLVDSASGTALEVRTGSAALNNIFVGQEVGQYNVTGHTNTVVGGGSMAANSSGFWNAALGYRTLRANTNGTRNVAVGPFALTNNLSGHRNVALGSFALKANTDGRSNIAIGADALFLNTRGDYNIAMGQSALYSSVTGSYNIVLGRSSGDGMGGCSYNVAIGDYALAAVIIPASAASIAIGRDALRNSTVGDSVAVGTQALTACTTGAGNTAVGNFALTTITDGSSSTAVGYKALRLATGANNTAVGASGLAVCTTGASNTALGLSALGAVTTTSNSTAVGSLAAQKATGERNTAIGAQALYGATGSTAMRNTGVGYGAGAAVATGADYNVFVGYSAGNATTTGASNILIGNTANAPTATSSSRLNIGGTLYGDLASDHIGVGVESMTAVLHLKAGTAAASTAPLKIDAGVVLTTPEPGAVEFDGTNLYFTTGAGVRKTLAVVA